MEQQANRQIGIVDDDEAIRDALTWLFASRGHQVITFDSGEQFLETYQYEQFGCLLLDVRMPGMSGQTLFETIRQLDYCPPVIFLTGHGDVPMAVQALKKGAIDFIEKPFNDNQLVDQVENALWLDVNQRKEWAEKQNVKDKLSSLTQREHEVMQLIIAGKLNKIIADELNISMKTVEVHRARVLEKMGVKSAVELTALLNKS